MSISQKNVFKLDEFFFNKIWIPIVAFLSLKLLKKSVDIWTRKMQCLQWDSIPWPLASEILIIFYLKLCLIVTAGLTFFKQLSIITLYLFNCLALHWEDNYDPKLSQPHQWFNGIAWSPRVRKNMGSSPDHVKPKTIK